MDLPDGHPSRTARAFVVRSRRIKPAGPGRATASKATTSNPFRPHRVKGMPNFQFLLQAIARAAGSHTSTGGDVSPQDSNTACEEKPPTSLGAVRREPPPGKMLCLTCRGGFRAIAAGCGAQVFRWGSRYGPFSDRDALVPFLSSKRSGQTIGIAPAGQRVWHTIFPGGGSLRTAPTLDPA
jgi:hypothetical protein